MSLPSITVMCDLQSQLRAQSVIGRNGVKRDHVRAAAAARVRPHRVRAHHQNGPQLMCASSGSRLPSFFSSTMPCAAIWRAMAPCSKRRNRHRLRLRPKVAKLDLLGEAPHQLLIDHRNRNLARIHRLAQLLIEINCPSASPDPVRSARWARSSASRPNRRARIRQIPTPFSALR